ncbi:MAG: hypothetical protein WD598_16255 [Acidimicrobiia bacterium]
MARPRLFPRFSVRSVDLGRCLDTFLVVAVASVLGNRIFLIITGYPQLGNGTLHISHAIWGALMMAIAIISAVTFLGPATRSFVAFLGGAGFGWFIDELGKFITRDVNYFFEPTFALMYITFVTMYLVFRSLERRRYGPDEGLLNGLEALKSAALGQLREPQRREAIALFDRTGPTGPIADQVRVLLDDAPALPPRPPSWPARVAAAVRSRYLSLAGLRWFPTAINSLFVVFAVIEVTGVVELGRDGRGIVTFAEWVTVVSSVAVAVNLGIGVVVLPRSRVAAYRWFDRGLLVHLYVVQIFVFAEKQLAGAISLVVTLAVWVLLRSAMRAERDEAALAA